MIVSSYSLGFVQFLSGNVYLHTLLWNGISAGQLITKPDKKISLSRHGSLGLQAQPPSSDM